MLRLLYVSVDRNDTTDRNNRNIIIKGEIMNTKKRDDLVIRIIPGDNFTPCALAEKLGAKVVLESSSYNLGKARHSLLMIDEAFRVIQHRGKVSVSGKNADIDISEFDNNFTDIISAVSSQHRALEFPFPAGGIGYFSFEFRIILRQNPVLGKQGRTAASRKRFLFSVTPLLFMITTLSRFILSVSTITARKQILKKQFQILKRKLMILISTILFRIQTDTKPRLYMKHRMTNLLRW